MTFSTQAFIDNNTKSRGCLIRMARLFNPFHSPMTNKQRKTKVTQVEVSASVNGTEIKSDVFRSRECNMLNGESTKS